MIHKVLKIVFRIKNPISKSDFFVVMFSFLFFKTAPAAHNLSVVSVLSSL